MQTPSTRSTAARFPGLGDGLAGHALFLDVDGTILETAPSPDRVEVPAGMVSLLQRLSRRLEGALAFVSGRTVAAVDALFAPLRLPVAGVHGGELRLEREYVTPDAAVVAQLRAALPLLRRAIAAMPGVWLEDKGCAVALHYREAPEQAREVRGLSDLVVGGLGPEFAVLLGKCVVEIRLRQLTKGTGLRWLMERVPFRDRTPIFAGDDVTDEDAFEATNALGGISVRVGPHGHTAATYTLEDPAQLRHWLQEIA